MLVVLGDRDGTNSVERQYIWGSDYSGTFEGLGGISGLLGMIDHIGITTEIYSYFYNGRGDIIQVIDDSGAVVANYTYDSFGFPENATGTLTQNFRFSTKFLDRESGFIYYGYRWYSPETMRWLSMDPLGEEGGINLYQFVLNNPITLYDALGLEAEGGDNEEQIVKAGALSGFLKFLKSLKRDPKKPGVKGAPKSVPNLRKASFNTGRKRERGLKRLVSSTKEKLVLVGTSFNILTELRHFMTLQNPGP